MDSYTFLEGIKMWNRTTHCTPVLLLSAVLLFASPVYANKLSDAMSSDMWHKEADELLLEEDGTLRRDAEKQVKKAWKKLKEAGKERFRLALIVQVYTEKGFDVDLAGKYADDALLTTDYESIIMNRDDADNTDDTDMVESDTSDGEETSGQQAASYKDDMSAVSDLIACRQNAELSEIFARILETTDGTKRITVMMEEMGEVLQGEELENVLPYALQAESADWDGAYLLHQVWVPEQSPADTAADLCARKDDAQRLLLLEAAGMSFSEPDEMLQYISSCAQLGEVPSACYPEGVNLSLDLSKLNQNSVSRANVDQTKILILSRNERMPRPYAYIISGESGEENHPDPEDCKVRLETEWMDQIPAEHLPSSFDEVNTVLLMDNQYFADGTMTVERETSFGENTGSSSTEDYQLYSALQVNSCFDWPSQSLLYSYGGHYTAPPEVPEEDRKDTSYGFSMIPDMVMKYYKADMDPEWADKNMREHVNALSQQGWSTEVSAESDSISDTSAADWDQILQELYPGRVGYLNEDQFSVELNRDRITLDWSSYAGSDTCDCYYMLFWKISDGTRYYWQSIAPGESTNYTFGAMPGVTYEIGIWQGTQAQPPTDGSLVYFTKEVVFDEISIDPADAGVILGGALIQTQTGDEKVPLEGALDPSVISQDGADVWFSVYLEPVDGKERDERLTYCLLAPDGRVYYSWYDISMKGNQVLYNLSIRNLLLQNSEDMGGSVESGEWSAFVSIDGVIIVREVFSIG